MPVIYFISAGDGGPIKIGLTNDVEQRLASLQTGCPYKMVLLGAVAGTSSHEKYHAYPVDTYTYSC